MRWIRWAIAIGLLGLHLVMKAPVWFLLDRVDVVSGSTGFHRAILIDSWIHNFSDWWLVGTKSTEAWASADYRLFDVTNNYVEVSANGGLLTLLLFLAVLVRCFSGVGTSIRHLARQGSGLGMQLMIWALGCALFAHCVSFLSVTYFDQNSVNWGLLLAMIATMAMLHRGAAVRTSPALRLPEKSPIQRAKYGTV